MNSRYIVKSIDKKKDCLSINWADNFKSKFHFLWLRDNCLSGMHPTANMRTFNILKISKKIYPVQSYIKNKKLSILWSEGSHYSEYDLKWLRDHCYTEIRNQKYISPYVFWNGKLKNNLYKIKLDYNEILSDDKILIKWLNLLHSYGFVIVKNAPTKKKSAFGILNRISHHRETFFGTPFEVINIPKPNNTAYTAEALRNHTDLPYFEYAPGYQFLHCLINNASGGESSVVDGFAIANYIKKKDKDVFKILTNTFVKFKDADYTQKAIRILHSPIITLTKDMDFNDIRFSMAAMGTIDIDPKKMKKFYDAYRYFASLLHNNKFKINFRIEAGDIFCFNNRRVLHGRTEFDPNSGERHLQGYYIERDEIIARLNYFNNVTV